MELESQATARSDEYVLFQLEEKSSEPLQVDVLIDGKPVPMEIDTGASVSVICQKKRSINCGLTIACKSHR